MVRTGVLAEVLGDFEDEAVAVVVGFERVQDCRQLTFFERTSTTAPMTCAYLAGCARCRTGRTLAAGAFFGATVLAAAAGFLRCCLHCCRLR